MPTRERDFASLNPQEEADGGARFSAAPAIISTAASDETVTKEVSLTDAQPKLPGGVCDLPFRASASDIPLRRTHTQESLERTIERQNDFLLRVIEALDHPFYVIDAQTYAIKLANSTARKNARAGANTCFALAHAADSPCEGRSHPCPLAEVKLSKRPFVVEHVHFSQDGAEHHVEVHAHPVLNDAGEVSEVIEYCLDITERKAREAAEHRLEEQVRYAEKLESLSILAGGVAHDFNNLLAGVLGNAELALLKLSSAAEARPNIEQIKEIAFRATGLTAQMLAYAGRGAFFFKTLDLNRLVTNAADFLRSSLAPNMHLSFDLAADLPPFHGDPSQISQVILNLTANAADAIREHGGVIILRTGNITLDSPSPARAPALQPLQAGRYLWLEVADSGCGIAQEFIGRLFDPFFSTKFAGRGLGLAAAYGIVRAHGGTITVESKKGEGSTFRAYFAETAS